MKAHFKQNVLELSSITCEMWVNAGAIIIFPETTNKTKHFIVYGINLGEHAINLCF